jgi:hypothetical protein
VRDDDLDITPARAINEGFRWAPVALIIGVLTVVIGGIIILVGWQEAGWFQSHQIARNYNLTVNSQAYQDGLLGEMQQHLTNITGPGGLQMTRQSVPAGSAEQVSLRASELNEIASLCSESARFVPQMEGPAGQQMQAVITANCLAGAPVATPPLANPVPAGGQ